MINAIIISVMMLIVGFVGGFVAFGTSLTMWIRFPSVLLMVVMATLAGANLSPYF